VQSAVNVVEKSMKAVAPQKVCA